MSQAVAAASIIPSNNTINPAKGIRSAKARNAMNRARKTATAAGANPKAAFGGAGMVQRFENLESRLDALEGSGGESVQATQPIQKFVTGVGAAGQVSTPPPAPIATGTLDASASPGSLDEAMPAPGDPASEMFGTEFMRNASVGAAKMRINKKL
tara:strand:+ start:130 stop:594 length:465 start_codon:yes stop_codon:yes gene_type:complete